MVGYLNLLQQETLCLAIVVEHPEMKYWLIQQPHIHPASWSLPSPVGLGENREKARRQVDWDNDSSWLFGKTNTTNSNVSHFSFFPWVFSAFYNAVWYGISPSTTGHSCPGYIPSQPIAHLQSTCWGWGQEREKVMTLCKHCPVIAWICVFWGDGLCCGVGWTVFSAGEVVVLILPYVNTP